MIEKDIEKDREICKRLETFLQNRVISDDLNSPDKRIKMYDSVQSKIKEITNNELKNIAQTEFNVAYHEYIDKIS